MCADITRSMTRVSLGIRASTSAAAKYRSATDAPLDEDRVHFLGPVNAACQGELDVRGPARAGDEVDDGAGAGPRGVPVPGLEEPADLAQRRDAGEHAAHSLELCAEGLQGLGPALGELSADRLDLGGRMLGARGDRRGEEARRLAHLVADAGEELGLGGHRVKPFSEAQRSWKV